MHNAIRFGVCHARLYLINIRIEELERALLQVTTAVEARRVQGEIQELQTERHTLADEMRRICAEALREVGLPG